ncbi:hypothetical protein IPZ58_35950 [Streptomyces roseoverticillatus]|uniref:hypothetical protein n=1 Tax=Streptomyces roseoverticillatus TaxID=66429 RepID=UPI0027E56E18|nr:hypothetical protein [Streptomyces roseoverticillatus]MCF3106918.1 hypothetical protein [Streptomyces roseoverticillatus]
MNQHEQIRTLLDDVLEHTGEERRHAFRQLVHLLAVHETAEETAEEEVVHPCTRQLPRAASTWWPTGSRRRTRPSGP